jgi:3-isopropylmalate/(R)-2-methylmalate dehydratase small subunit
VDPIAGSATESATGRQHACTPIPPHLMQMIADGGLLPHLEKRLSLAHGRQP